MTRRSRIPLLAAVLTASALAVPTPAGATPTTLYISQYLAAPGSQAIEIRNGSLGAVTLDGAADVWLDIVSETGAVTQVPLNTGATVAAGDTWVVGPAGSAVARNQDVPPFDVDDTIVLRQGAVVRDSIGQRGTDPGAAWQGTNPGTALAADTAGGLAGRACAAEGDTNPDDAYSPAVEWVPPAAGATAGFGAAGMCWSPRVKPVAAWYGTVTASDGASAAMTDLKLSEPVPAALAAAIAADNPDPARVGARAAAYTVAGTGYAWAWQAAQNTAADAALRTMLAGYPATTGRTGTVTLGSPAVTGTRVYYLGRDLVMGLRLGGRAAALPASYESIAAAQVTYRAQDATFTPATTNDGGGGGGGGAGGTGGGAGTTPTPGTTTTTAGPRSGPVAAPTFTTVVTLPPAKQCASRRSFPIRLTHPPGTRIVSAVVKLNGKQVAIRKGARVTAPVNLRGLPKGRFTVDIAVKLTDGRTVKGRRAYRTCTPKQVKRRAKRAAR